MSSSEFDSERLRHFRPFEALDAHQLLLVASKMAFLEVPKGRLLFKHGEIDSTEYFLLDGEVELSSEDGISHRVDFDHPSARRQLARLRPRQYSATTTRFSVLATIDADMLEELQMEQDSTSEVVHEYSVDEIGSVEDVENLELVNDLRDALARNKFVLPSLPEVAVKVQQLLEDDNVNAERLASAVNADPAIAAKLLRAANSPMYHGNRACVSTKDAIVRLGLDTTRQLVVSFAVRDLFNARSAVLRKKMLMAWRHSVEVAAISFVLGQRLERRLFSPETTMLSGLVHDIGLLAVIAYLDRRNLEYSEDQVDDIAQQLAGEVGELILTRWKFSQDMIEAARGSRDWTRDHIGDPDLCDVVQVAKLHSAMRSKLPLPVTRIDDLPAFRKLPLGELTPQLTMGILDEAKEQIAAIKQVLSG